MGFIEDVMREKKELMRERRVRLDFVKAIRDAGKKVNPVIAEVKPRSPTMGDQSIDPVSCALEMEGAGACALSVLTDEKHFGGSYENLKAIREHVTVPILCKDFILDDIQVYEAFLTGADAVLLIARALHPKELERLSETILSLGMTPLVEVDASCIGNIDEIVDNTPSRLFGVNERDLSTLKVSGDAFPRIRPLLPDDYTVVAMSGIKDRAGVVERLGQGADAVLLGSSIMQAGSIGDAVRELVRR